MRTLVLIPLLVLTYLAAAQNCPNFVCNPPGMLWADWLCGMQKPYNASQYALKDDACNSDEQCTLNNWNNGPATCLRQTQQNTNDAYPGEPCNDQHSCGYGGNCVNNACTAQKQLEACNQGCGLGLTCFGGVCYPLSKVGEQCTADTDCVTNAGCNNGVCVEYLSIAPHKQVDSCGWSNGVNYLCASTLCYSRGNNNNGPFFCSGFVKSPSALPVKCTGQYSQCTSTPDSVSGNTFQTSCQCGYDGFQYCGLFPGDAPMRAYLSNVRAYLNSTAIHQCSTLRRPTGNNSNPQDSFISYMSDWCATQTFNFTKKMVESYYYAMNYQQVVHADRCVLKVLQPAYYNATERSVTEFLPEEEEQ